MRKARKIFWQGFGGVMKHLQGWPVYENISRIIIWSSISSSVLNTKYSPLEQLSRNQHLMMCQSSPQLANLSTRSRYFAIFTTSSLLMIMLAIQSSFLIWLIILYNFSPSMWLSAQNFEACYFICERTLLTMIFVDMPSSENQLWRPGIITILFWKMNSKFLPFLFQLSILLIIWQGTLGKISFTTDAWSCANLQPYFAIMAHCAYCDNTDGSIKIKARLIAFHRIYGTHDGKKMAQLCIDLLDRAGITANVKFFEVYST